MAYNRGGKYYMRFYFIIFHCAEHKQAYALRFAWAATCSVSRPAYSFFVYLPALSFDHYCYYFWLAYRFSRLVVILH